MAIQSGTYRAQALPDTAILIESEKKKTPGISLELAVAGNERIAWTGWLTGGAIAMTVKALRAMGWTGGPSGDDITDFSGLGSKECELVIEEEEYEGKYYPKIKFVNEIGGGPRMGAAMDDARKKQFAAQMRGAIRAVGGGSATPKPAAQAQAQAQRAPSQSKSPDDDLPF